MTAITPTRRRTVMCSGCPFNLERVGSPIPEDVLEDIDRRITGGEAWVCHQTCDGAVVTSRSSLCAGAPEPPVPHDWLDVPEGTALTRGVAFRFCNRCDREEWANGTVRPGRAGRSCS